MVYLLEVKKPHIKASKVSERISMLQYYRKERVLYFAIGESGYV